MREGRNVVRADWEWMDLQKLKRADEVKKRLKTAVRSRIQAHMASKSSLSESWNRFYDRGRKPSMMRSKAYIWMTCRDDQPGLFFDVVRFFGKFTVNGRCLDRNPPSLLVMLEQTLGDDRNGAFNDCFTRATWLRVATILSITVISQKWWACRQ